MECPPTTTRPAVKLPPAPTAAVPTSTTPSAPVPATAAAAPVPQPSAAVAAPVAAAAAPASTNVAPQPAAATVTCPPNVVTIPVPIVSQEDIYTYVSIKGSLHDRSSALFGLNDAEVLALSKRFENGTTQIVNGVMINAPPMQLINTLSQLGYKVICSTGEAEIVWTMQREA